MASATETVTLLVKLLADAAQFSKTFDDAKKKAHATAEQIARSFQDVTQKISVGAGLMGGAIVGGLAMAANAASDFDSAFAKVTTMLSKEQRTPEFITKLKDGIFEVAKGFGIETPDAIQAMYDALSSGIPADNVVDFLKNSAMAARAGVTDLKNVVDVTTSVMKAYPQYAGDVAKINDIIFAGVKVGKIEYEHFSQSLGQVLPIAAAVGVSFEDLVGAISALTLSGFKPAQAIESLRSMLSNVIKPSKDAEEAAQGLGIKWDAAALKAQGLTGFLNGVYEAMSKKVDWKVIDEDKVEAEKKKLEGIKKKIEETQQALTDPKNFKKKPELTKKLEELQAKAKDSEKSIADLYTTAAEKLDRETGAAKLVGDVQGLAAFLALGNDNAKVFNESINATNNALGSTADAAKAINENDPSLTFKTLKATMQEFWVSVGRPFLEKFISPLAKFMTEIAQGMTNWTKAHPDLSTAILTVVGVIGLLLILVSGIAAALTVISGMYLTITGASAAMAGGFTAVGAGATAAATGTAAAGTTAGVASTGFFALAAAVWAVLAPILIAVGIFLLIVAALVLLYLGLKKLAESEYGKKFFDWLVSAWEATAEAVSKAWDATVEFFENFWDGTKQLVSDVGDFFYELGDTIIDAIGEAIDWCLEKLQGLWDSIKKAGAVLADFLNPFSDVSGGAAAAGVPAFASGGIVTRRTLATVGEAGPEAIIPLRGGAVPVQLSPGGILGGNVGAGGSGSAMPPVTVNVYPVPGQSPEQIADSVANVIARRIGMA